MIAYLIGQAIHFVTETAAGKGQSVTPETILFNQLDLTNINFFKGNSTNSFTATLQSSIASWYYTMRTIAIIGSLCVLLYIAIRMATSTIASEQAEYKRMLIDWAVGFALIFVLHYIIILVINGNDLIVNILRDVMATESSGGSEQLTSYLDKLEKEVIWHVDLSQSLGAIIVYLIFVVITLAFLLMYIKRMIVVAFLIIIAPLITITYAIDRVKDKESQALDAWLKEFIWTILIQPFHCVIYVVFVSMALNGLSEGSLSASVLAIMCMVFILQAEDIVKKIFGIQADNIGKMSSSMAMAAGGALVASKFAGKGAGKAGQGVSKAANAVAKNFPKTKDGTGMGIGPTSEGKPNSFSQKMANAMGSDIVQKNLKKFNNLMEDNKFGRAASSVGKFAKNYTSKSYTAASTLAGVAFSMPGAQGLQNLVEGGFAGYAAGQAVKAGAKWAGKKSTIDVIENGRTRNAVSNLNESYQQMKAKSGFSDKEMMEKAKAYLKLDCDVEDSGFYDKLSEAEKLFAHNLQALQHQLEKVGEDTSVDNVINKIKLKDNDQNQNPNSNTGGPTV